MIIRSMTATFGKLEHTTLTLHPGLNIIEAPNEWGKSTWCAFLTAMLYGMETRVKSTKTALADKERYLPWSGSPMSGRMEIEWNGRQITIERKTKGRIPMGQFTAYETESGVPVEEITAANCGQMLLGVEKSVFLRGGFVRLNDMPLTQDEALRARLNALVTTGDDSGDGQRLGRALKELKNRCRYNQSGLLPQAQAEREAVTRKLQELAALEVQSARLTERREEVERRVEELENHNEHLRYEKSRQDARRVTQAEQDYTEAQNRLTRAQLNCIGAIPRDEAEQKLLRLRNLNQQALDLQMEARMLPQHPEKPEAPDPFRDMDGAGAVEKARQDGENYRSLRPKRFLLLLTCVLALAGGVLCLWSWICSAVLLTLGAASLILYWVNLRRITVHRGRIADVYGTEDPSQWLALAESWAETEKEAQMRMEAWRANRSDLLSRYEALRKQMTELTEGREQQARADWERSLTAWNALSEAVRQANRAEQYRQTVGAMAVHIKPPESVDTLTCSDAETVRMLSDARGELQQLSARWSQYQGRMEALGDRASMERTLEKLEKRIGALEDTYAALTIALETLSEATMELQRRFAPQISCRAQELMAAFTQGRYDRLSLGEDLTLRAGAGEEDTLHDALWRSDGTIDQLYLALRLALAENLTPQAPLVLDDALARFDDGRLKATMAVLEQEAENKQVILFTCQSREKSIWNNKEEAI